MATTVRDTIRTALIKLRHTRIGKEPDADTAAYCLQELRNLIEHMAGHGASGQVEDIRVDQSQRLPESSPQARLLITVGGLTITLPRLPRDGARVYVVDTTGAFGAAPVTLEAQDMRIAGQPSLALNTAGYNEGWMFRADLGSWEQITNLTLDSPLPFPAQFDQFWGLALAMRVGNTFALRLGPDDQRAYVDGRDALFARYVRPIPAEFESAVWRAGSLGWRNGDYLFDARYQNGLGLFP